MNGAAAERGRMARFAAVSAVGGLFDFAATWLLLLLDVPDYLAIAAGIVLAGGLSFIAHEIWTFRTHGAPQPHGRILRWSLLVVVSWALRLFIFQETEALLPDEPLYDLAALAFAFAVSGGTNYLVSRFLVFSRKP